MPCNDSQKPLKTLSSSFDNFIRETIGENFSWERRDINSCWFSFEDISESFKVRVATSDDGVAEFEGGDIGLETPEEDRSATAKANESAGSWWKGRTMQTIS